MTDDLVPRLLALARAEHDDLSVAEEAAHELQALRETVGGWEIVADLCEEDYIRLQRQFHQLVVRHHRALNVRRSDDRVGLVCATCGLPAESEPCPDHSPEGQIKRLEEALQFYADPEAWSALPHAPIIGHRWDRWCYGGEVAQWALEGQPTARKGFEGPPQPS